jgi:hypothetical protein
MPKARRLDIAARVVPTIGTLMSSRVIAAVLALILFCAGLTTHVQAASIVVTGGGQAESAPPAAGPVQASHEGLDDNHSLDDVPAQAQAESQSDLPDQLMDRSDTPASGWVTGKLRRYDAAIGLAPCLVGLQRPPCTAPHID